VAGVVLIDPVLPLVPAMPDHYVTPMLAAYAVPGLGPLLMSRRRRLSPEDLVDNILSLCCVDTSRVPADVLGQHVKVARQALLLPRTEQEISAAARSIIAIFAGDLRGRAYRQAIGSITCPVLLLHGTRDRLVPIAVARAAARANPAWTMIEMPGVGHVPQLEAPVTPPAPSSAGSAPPASPQPRQPARHPPPGPPEPAPPKPDGASPPASAPAGETGCPASTARSGESQGGPPAPNAGERFA